MATTIDFLKNPRRATRVQASCSASVTSAVGAFEAATEDISALGCRIVAPRLVRKGEPINLVLTAPGIKAPLKVNGTVAWTTSAAPWRMGIAFDERNHPESTRWFSQLLSAAGLTRPERAPDRIPLQATVYLCAPPRFVLDVTPAEMALLEEIGTGTTVLELVSKLPEQRAIMERALFSLLAQRLATLSRGVSVHPNAWGAVLGGREAVVGPRAVEQRDTARTAAVRESGAARGTPIVVPMIPPTAWS
jgi:hypothetical protein